MNECDIDGRSYPWVSDSPPPLSTRLAVVEGVHLLHCYQEDIHGARRMLEWPSRPPNFNARGLLGCTQSAKG
ncbi:hypothetical protein Dimus_003875, partial [Dionaea muscipula]